MNDNTGTKSKARGKEASRRCVIAARRSSAADRLERAYRELGFVPMRGCSAVRPFSRDFVFTPPSFLPNVPYTVTPLAGV